MRATVFHCVWSSSSSSLTRSSCLNWFITRFSVWVCRRLITSAILHHHASMLDLSFVCHDLTLSNHTTKFTQHEFAFTFRSSAKHVICNLPPSSQEQKTNLTNAVSSLQPRPLLWPHPTHRNVEDNILSLCRSVSLFLFYVYCVHIISQHYKHKQPAALWRTRNKKPRTCKGLANL